MKIGYIGIGIMGEPMARNLLKAGNELYINNRTAGKCDRLAGEGAKVSASPAEMASSTEVLFINVPDTPDVEKVIFGDNGIAQTARSGLVVIDNSTISAAETRIFAEKLKQKGVDYLDAPVSGGDIGAKKGTLAVMVGGDPNVFERCRPLLETIGSKIVHVGAVGMGQTCKACNQLLCAIHMAACCESIALAKRAGLEPATMLEVVTNGAGNSWALSNLGPKIVSGDMAPGFSIDLLSKDLRLVTELAEQCDISLKCTELAEQLFADARQDGNGKLGTQSLWRTIAKDI